MKVITKPRVDILMATYNGEKFLADQIDSILRQTHGNIHLLIRDDGSQDDTCGIIQQKMKQYPEKITQVPTEGRLGIIGNFSALMKHSQAKYVMFSDQDDIWLPQKIEKTLDKMHELEGINGMKCPLLIHTDLQVVDANLNVIDRSFWNYSKLFPQQSQTLNRLLMQNVITGCTMMMNRPLVDLANPIPAGVMMHDWWIGLVAAALGKIDCISEPTMLYRQHGNNQVGAKKEQLFHQIFRFFKHPKEHILLITTFLGRQCRQAALFANVYKSKLNVTQKHTVDSFCLLTRGFLFRKTYLICKFGFLKNGWLRNMRMLLLLLFVKPEKS